MREILFRGKRTSDGEWDGERDGEWIEGTLFRLASNLHPFIMLTDRYGESYEVDSKTVGQFTGLTDKNGKKVFEGDIVAQNWYDHDEPSDDSFGEVVFCEYDCSFSVMDIQKDGIVPLGRCHAYHWEAEVIGNIHDNPELLENP